MQKITNHYFLSSDTTIALPVGAQIKKVDFDGLQDTALLLLVLSDSLETATENWDLMVLLKDASADLTGYTYVGSVLKEHYDAMTSMSEFGVPHHVYAKLA